MPNISNAARDIPQLFKSELQKDEKILWTGRPEPQWFTPTDIIAVPFSLIWGGFAFFWEGSVLHIYLTEPKAGAIIFMVIWGIPFCVIGSYMIFGRFFYQRWLQKNMFYAVTNQRIIILSTARGRSTQTLFLDRLPDMTKSVNKNGVGNLFFGGDPRMGDPRLGAAAQGLTANPFGLGRKRGVQLSPAFANIKDVNKVYDLITKQHQTP